MTTNKVRIEKKLRGTGFKIGCYSVLMESLEYRSIRKIIETMENNSGYVDVMVEKKPYLVEISHVDDEIDFKVISRKEYIRQYGNERYE